MSYMVTEQGRHLREQRQHHFFLISDSETGGTLRVYSILSSVYICFIDKRTIMPGLQASVITKSIRQPKVLL